MDERKVVLTFDDGETKEILLTEEHFDCETMAENDLNGNRLSISRVFWWNQAGCSNLHQIFHEIKAKKLSSVKYLVNGTVSLEETSIFSINYSIGDLVTKTGLRQGHGTEFLYFMFS